MGTVSRVHTFASGAILTAAQLNNEFDNLLTSSAINGGLDATNLGVTAGQATASKALVVDASRNLADATGSNRINNLALSGTFESTGAVTASAGITSGGNIVSDTDSTDDLGTTGVRWANLFVDDVTVTNNVTIGGTLTLTGGITLNGNTTIGDSSADTLTVNSTITSNLIFTDATYDIGASGATRPRDLFLSRNAVMGGTLGVTGLITASGGVSGALTGDVTGNISGTTGTFSGAVNANNLVLDASGNYPILLENQAGTTADAAISTFDDANGTLLALGSNFYFSSGGSETRFNTSEEASAIVLNRTGTISLRTSDGSNNTVERVSVGNTGDVAINTSQLFVDQSASRVGINTSSADASLHIEGSSISDLVKVEDTGTDSNPNIQIANDARSYNLQVVGARSDAFEIWDRTAGATRLTVDTSGNMGLGVTPSGYFADKFVVSAGNADGITIAASATSDVNYFLFADGTSGNAAYRGQIVYDHGNDIMQFATAAAAALTIDSSQRVGIGTASPTCRTHIRESTLSGFTPDSNTNLAVEENSTSLIEIAGTDSGILFSDASAWAGRIFYTHSSDEMAFATAQSNKMTLDSSGNLLIGYTSSNGSYKLQVNSQIFATNATIATSDGRYKENVQTLSNATDLVTRLNPVQFKWKDHEIHNLDVGKTDVGFIAQEVQEVLSDADYSDSVVVINKTDDEGYLGLGETKLIPLLTAALQEAIAKIETLETKVAALEAA